MIACFERISARDRGWRRAHPFDLAHGVQTSGRLPGYLLQPDDPFDAPTVAYIAAQPSIIRAALATVPQPERCHFFDLGCGKGRPLLVASEFSFAGLTGVELAPALAAIARSNAATFARAYPERRRITIVNGDATQLGYPAGSLAIFLYNPFGRPLVARVLANLAAAMQAAPREVYVIYYNPTWPSCSTPRRRSSAASPPTCRMTPAKPASAPTPPTPSWCGRTAAIRTPSRPATQACR